MTDCGWYQIEALLDHFDAVFWLRTPHGSATRRRLVEHIVTIYLEETHG